MNEESQQGNPCRNIQSRDGEMLWKETGLRLCLCKDASIHLNSLVSHAEECNKRQHLKVQKGA